MKHKDEIELRTPRPYEVTETKFRVHGKIPKSWLLHGRYGLSLDLMDVSGHEFMGTSAEVVPGIFFKFKKKLRFYSHVNLSHYETPKHPRGLIIEISGHGDRFFLLPVIIKGTEKVEESDKEKLKEELSNSVKKIIKLKLDYESYKGELHELYKGVVHNKEILEGVFGILEQSKDGFEEFYESEEDKLEKALTEKYKDAIAWRGPMLRGVAGRMTGFEFRVYSGDHDPKHFHVIHKSRGIDARFSYPQIELINYKGRSITIGRKESEKIRHFFGIAANLQKLTEEFQKQIS